MQEEKSNERFDTEPVDSPTPTASMTQSSKQTRSSGLAGLQRQLSDDELNEPGVKKMLLNILDTLTEENQELKGRQAELMRKDKALAVLTAKYESVRVNSALKNLFANLGWALLGSESFLMEKGLGIGVCLSVVIAAVVLIAVPHVEMKRLTASKEVKDEA